MVENFTSLIVVINYMESTEVFTIVVLKSLVSVAYSDVPVCLVACHLSNLEKELKIHHVVNDNRAVPTSFCLPLLRIMSIPRLEDTCSRTESCCERLRCVHENCIIARKILQTESVSIAVIDHETYVMVPFQELNLVKDLSMLLSLLSIVLVSGEFIHIPECAGKKSAYPVICRHEFYLTMLVSGRYSQCVSFLCRSNQQCKLLFSMLDVFLDDVLLWCALN